MGDFRRLRAWTESSELARDLHAAFSATRRCGYPGLRVQILRAAASVPANLAEGCARRSRIELARFADIAYASAKEVESHLQLARDVQALSEQQCDEFAQRVDQVARLCFGLARPSRAKPEPSAGSPDRSAGQNSSVQ